MDKTLAVYLIIVAFFAGRFEQALEVYLKGRRHRDS